MKEERWIVIPAWERFQHYRDRDPKWIKVYSSLLSDDDYLDLSAHLRAVLHGLWLSYALSNRKLRWDATAVSRRLNLRVRVTDLAALETAGFIVSEAQPERSEVEWASRYVSDESRQAVLERDENKCVQCGATTDLEIDHVVPISKGGTGEIQNLQTLCRPCNRRKHNSGASVAVLSSIRPPREEVEKKRKEKNLPLTSDGSEGSGKPKPIAHAKEAKTYGDPQLIDFAAMAERAMKAKAQLENGGAA